jgi:hypothetical protein
MVNNLVLADLLYGVYWLVKRHRKKLRTALLSCNRSRHCTNGLNAPPSEVGQSGEERQGARECHYRKEGIIGASYNRAIFLGRTLAVSERR